jgi:hypothetical protein
MSDFWILRDPRTADAERRLADWPDDEPLEYQRVSCPVNPEGHLAVRNRVTTPLSALLPDLEPLDFVWTHLGECLIQRHVLDVLSDLGFIGFEAIPARVRFKSWKETPPHFWELAIKGSAGLASADSGYRVLKTCPGCGVVYDTKIEDPTKIVDRSKWDGSDFFRVEPVSGWIFTTNRVIQSLRGHPFKGWKAYSLGEMKESFDIAVPGYSPNI